MFVSKYVSSQEIINKVYRDTGTQVVLNQDDLIEWIFEALQLMGTTLTLIPRHTGPLENPDYEFENYRVQLPCDFHKLVQVSVNGYPCTPASNSFHHLLDAGCCGTSLSDSVLDAFTDNFGNTFTSSIGPVVGYSSYNPVITFDINENYITFNAKTGKCCLAYWAIPVDKNGLPLVPDETKVKEAITRYLIMKLDFIGWRTNQVPKDVYLESKQQYEWYIGSASNHLKMPDIAQMEGLKNMMIKLKPNHQEYSNFFKNLTKNQGYR